jgi:S1-C subfamily serine protease
MRNFLISCILLFSSQVYATPVTLEDFRSVTVQVTVPDGSTGGTGTILTSSIAGSVIVTNAHVCELVENGGFVVTTQGKFAVQKILKDPDHDLCLVGVTVNLGLKSKIASSTPKPGSNVRISGHPYLLPHMLVSGHLSNSMQVELITELVPCTEEDFSKSPMICMIFDGMPIVRVYNAITASALIAPGNSGSAVYNDEGHIIALVFAGIGRAVSPALLVPHEYIVNFLNKSKNRTWTDVSKGVKLSTIMNKKTKVKKSRAKVATLNELLNIEVLPASKDQSIDIMYRKLTECKGDSKSCSKK